MMASCLFDRLMQPLLHHLNVSAPTLTENQGITVDFEHISIRFTPLSHDEILIVASLGCLPSEHHEDLAWLLLEQSSFDQPPPLINLAVLGEKKTLLLWCRERFVNLDSSTLIALFDRLVDKANEIIRLLATQKSYP